MRNSLKKSICLLICLTLVLSCSIAIVAAALDTALAAAATREELMVPLTNDYQSRTETVYNDINGEDVTVYGLYRETAESGHNPNFSQALMIYQAMKYKEKYPEKPVYVSIQSFHLSVALAACVDPAKPDYGHLKNLYDADFNSDGYYRLSYLLVEAAKMGIGVCVVGQIDAAGTAQEDGIVKPDFSFVNYFNSHLNDDAYEAGKKVSDFMTFGNCEWKSYGDKAGADMMHNKSCTVSNYIDNSGNEHGAAIWLGSINIDGVNINEQNGNDSIQTAVVITGHEAMRRVLYNYAKLVAAYCRQEDVVPFRVEAISKTTEQVQLIMAGKSDEIDADEQIVYLGTEDDGVFELYFTPLGGDFSVWDTVYNPFVKYISELLSASYGDDYIEFIWNNPKYTQNFELGDYMLEAVNLAFERSANPENVLHLHLPGAKAENFTNLTPGVNIGYKFFNGYYINYHIKDLQLSYVKGGKRQYITVLNSLNIHEGSGYHQTNTILVIKENDTIGNDFYLEYAAMTVKEIDFLARGRSAAQS